MNRYGNKTPLAIIINTCKYVLLITIHLERFHILTVSLQRKAVRDTRGRSHAIPPPRHATRNFSSFCHYDQHRIFDWKPRLGEITELITRIGGVPTIETLIGTVS